MRLTFYYYR